MSALYGKGREKFARGQIDWVGDDIRFCLVTFTLYTPDFVNDEFLSSVSVSARVVTLGQSLQNKTAGQGVLDADDEVLLAVSGPVSHAIVLFKHTGSDATAPLIALIDQGTNLPVTPNGNDITIAWDNGANKILVL